jgi:hypothetical protein
VVEHSIGNGEVDSSILSGSTIHPTDQIAIYVIDFANLIFAKVSSSRRLTTRGYVSG